ncbi:hypothetical protein ACFJI0_22975 [Hydrogenophaga sp. UC242_53]|uniref:hypothetical protein n=1 Tax=Hydrogenophaga sp. UC242_53 TaxID=3350170 RepID=UPI0036D3BEEC
MRLRSGLTCRLPSGWKCVVVSVVPQPLTCTPSAAAAIHSGASDRAPLTITCWPGRHSAFSGPSTRA